MRIALHILHVWLCGPGVAALFLCHSLLVTRNAHAAMVARSLPADPSLDWPIPAASIFAPLALVLLFAHAAVLTGHWAHWHGREPHDAEPTPWSDEYAHLPGFVKWQLEAFRPRAQPRIDWQTLQWVAGEDPPPWRHLFSVPWMSLWF